MAGSQADGKRVARKGQGPLCSKAHCEGGFSERLQPVRTRRPEGQRLEAKQLHTTTQRTWEAILKVTD